MTECIISTKGAPVRKGYYQYWKSGRRVMAHRQAYEDAYGPFNKALFVLHTCDNPPCVNPDHLYLGTHAKNMKDRQERGRTAKPNAVLTDYIEDIRGLIALGMSNANIARIYDVGDDAISKIRLGKSWK